MDINVRKSNIWDIDDIIKLWYELQLFLKNKIQGLNDIILPQDFSQKKKHYNIIFNSEKYNVFVMECNNKLVGFMEVSINNKDFDFSIDDYEYIAYFYVKSDFRDLSSISKLYKIKKNWIKANNLKYICSDVDGENTASIQLQQKFWGWEPFKIRMAKRL